MQAQQAKLLPVVASAELSHCLPCIALAYTSQPCQKGQHILMLRGTLYVRKEHQLAFLNLLLAKESNCKGQLGRRGVKRPEVSCSFFFPSLHLLCKCELIYLLKQQIHNYTQSALTNGVKEATGSKVICLRPCSLSYRQ